MRASLIIFGVIFLVIGALLYYIPVQQFSADTSTAGTEGSGTQTSSASLTVPVGWSYAFIIIGFVLLVLGLAIPGVKGVQGPRGPRGSRGSRTVVAVQGQRGPRGRRGSSSRGNSVTTTTRTKS